MAQNGFDRRSCNATRTFPGTAARLTLPSNNNSRGGVASSSGGGGGVSTSGVSSSTNNPSSHHHVPPPPPSRPAHPSSGGGGGGGGSVPTMFVRPLSRSQLAPVHVGSGGGATLMLSPNSSSSSQSSPSSHLSALPSSRQISLDQPRPSSERHGNVYLGAPVSHHHSNSSNGASGGNGGIGGSSNSILVIGGNGGIAGSNISHRHHHHLQTNHHHNNHHHLHSLGGVGGVGGGSLGSSATNNKSVRLDSKITAAEQVRLPTNSRTKKGHSDNSSSHSNLMMMMSNVVTSQPTTKRNLLKPPNDQSVSTSSSSNSSSSSSSSESGKATVKLAESSITCPYCRKCRCEACATPRPLPSRWICSKSIHCGPEPLLDYVTCLCCVKAVFYHCGKNHEPDGGVLCADKPCSCAPHRKFWRWGCMAAMSLVLPCLCLYWPCRGCIGLAEKAYQKYHNNGCTCHRSSPTNNTNPNSQHPNSSEERAEETTAGTDLSEDEDHLHHLHIIHHPPTSSSPSNRYSHPPVVPSRQLNGGNNKFLPLTEKNIN